MNEREQIGGKVAKARGYFFAAFETLPYVPLQVVIGQYKAESCVAACCRMLLLRDGIEVSEAFIRHALGLREGAFVSQIPEALQSFGFSTPYAYQHDLSIEDLAAAVGRGPAVAFVKTANALDGHALLVDEIANDLVAVRDPLPEGEGKAYRVGLADFLSVWIRLQNGRGQATIVIG